MTKIETYEQAQDYFRHCRLCPRACNVDRSSGSLGRCHVPMQLTLARAALHNWEEPCISGSRGSGAVFFSGCSLGCGFCQNREIAGGRVGMRISPERLSEIFLELQEKGAANLNLVTPTHYVPLILLALHWARREGFSLPVVYNCSGYESVQTLQMLEGYVDIYLPDMKYALGEVAARYSFAPDYPQVALLAIKEMVRQTGECVYDEEGYLLRGTLIRHLILPQNTKNSKAVLRLLVDTFGKDVSISLMNQYTPMCEREGEDPFFAKYPELTRRVTAREYDKVLEEAFSLGITNGYVQEGETAKESFIPAFDYEGVERKS